MKDVLNPKSLSGINMLFFIGLLKMVYESDMSPYSFDNYFLTAVLSGLVTTTVEM